VSTRGLGPEALLVACPAFNEEAAIVEVVTELTDSLRATSLPIPWSVAVFDDGSADRTVEMIKRLDVSVFARASNGGYGFTLREIFEYAVATGFSHVLTFDTDGQHSCGVIPTFVAKRHDTDIVSGSRYLRDSVRVGKPPAPGVNALFTRVIRRLTKFPITDVGCGMKLISTRLVQTLSLVEDGYAFPLEFWLEAERAGGSVCEVSVPMIYLDPRRSLAVRFGSISAAVEYGARTILHTARRQLSLGSVCGVPSLEMVSGVLIEEITRAREAGLEITFPVKTTVASIADAGGAAPV
jgi:glycosyltransferase involved in cell wall biosynthesis